MGLGYSKDEVVIKEVIKKEVRNDNDIYKEVDNDIKNQSVYSINRNVKFSKYSILLFKYKQLEDYYKEALEKKNKCVCIKFDDLERRCIVLESRNERLLYKNKRLLYKSMGYVNINN
jgi:hypothetical protein